MIRNNMSDSDYLITMLDTFKVPEEILNNNNEIVLSRNLINNNYDLITEYILTMIRILKDNELSLIKNNFSTLTISKCNFIEALKNNNAAAFYNLVTNSIKYIYNYKHSIFHELIHASSTYLQVENKKYSYVSGVLIGFNNIILARELNEGITEYYTCKYFSKDITELPFAFLVNISYCKMLELIIGEEKLRTIYFTGKFNEVFKTLTTYKSIEEYIDCMNYIDYTSDIILKKNILNRTYEDYMDKINYVCNYFRDIYNIILINQKLEIETYYKKINEFDDIQDNLYESLDNIFQNSLTCRIRRL